MAYFAAAANLVAAGLMALVLRSGLPPRTIAERAAWISSNGALWHLGWLSWNVAAVSLLALLVVLADRWRSESPLLCSLAVVLATAGIAADLTAEAVLMRMTDASSLGTFEAVQTGALLTTGFVANGLYTVAGILLTVAGRRRLPASLVALAVPMWAAGLVLAAASLADATTLTIVATAVLMPLFVIWTALLGRWLGSPAAS